MKGIAGRKAADALNPERRPAFRMNSITKAYLLTAMLALSTVSFGLGGVGQGVQAQATLDAVFDAVDGCVLSEGPDSSMCEDNLTSEDPYGVQEAVDEDVSSAPSDDCDDGEIGVDSICEDSPFDSGPDDCPECVPVPFSNTIFGLINLLFGPEGLDEEDRAPFFSDDGADDDQEVHIVVPNSTAILGSQDSDGDGYSDFEELSGCGTGVPINPFNRHAHCDNYDGDGLDNDDDPNPFTPDDLLILSAVRPEREYAAPAHDLVFEYQCYKGVEDLQVTIVENPDASSNRAVVPSTMPEPTFINASGDSDSGDCHEAGLITFEDLDLNVTGDQKGDHNDGVFDFVITGNQSGGGPPVASNTVVITVTNAAEEGTWTPTCTLNETSNGYCGEPGDTATVNGVEITYDANRFPDKHPHPSVPVTYTVDWVFNHTSYDDDGQNITRISMMDYISDPSTNAGDNIITHGGDVDGDGHTVLPNGSADVQSFTGDDLNDRLYTITVDYTVGPETRSRSIGHDRHIAVEMEDRGGGLTYWGELGAGLPVIGDTESDDHDKVFLGLPQFSRINQVPKFSYVDIAHNKAYRDESTAHNNTKKPFVIHDQKEDTVALRVFVHDNRSHGDVGAPGDDLNVSVHYAIADSLDATGLEFTTISDLPTSRNLCTGLGVPVISPSECEFEGDDSSGSPTDDGVDDRIDGNSFNSEVFEAIISVEESKVLHYTFSVVDSDGVEVEYGTDFTYVVGQLPPDVPESSLAGQDLDVHVQGLVDSIDDAIEMSAGALTGDGDSGDTGDPWDTNENGITDEPNGQVDVVERFGYYIDTDEGSSRDAEHFDKFDGYNGADGVSLHLAPTGGTGIEEAEHPVVRVGDVAGSDLFELAVLTDGSQTLCVVEHPSQLDVSLYFGGAFDSDADAPCGDELTTDMTLKVVQISNDGFTGIIVYDDVDNDDERDGAEGRRSNVLAASCEDVLIVAIDETNLDQSIVQLLAVEPHEQDPCEDGDGGDDGPLGDDSDGDGVPDTVDDEVPDEGATDDSDGDGIPDVVDDEVPEEGVGGDSDGDGVPDAVEDNAGPLCVRGTPIGSVGICYSERYDSHFLVLGPFSRQLPF